MAEPPERRATYEDLMKVPERPGPGSRGGVARRRGRRACPEAPARRRERDAPQRAGGSRLRTPGACESRQGTWLPPAGRKGDDPASLPPFDAVSFDLSPLRAP